jgi:hypothetical protein
MKANELRIGNLVGVDIQTMEVTSILTECCILKTRAGMPYTIDYGDIYPIPLTEEWLLKFGFVKKVDFEQQEYEYGKLSESNKRRGVGLYNFTGEKLLDYWCVTFREDVGCGWSDLNEIEYVHELQNLYFALTNEELILTNQPN